MMGSLSAKDFLACCGSSKFASEMAKVAAFSSPSQAVEASRTIWWNKALLEVHKERIISSKVSCLAYPAESRPPLTKEEEFQCFADVQDLITLEKKKSDLERELGRIPSYQEWANYVGCSICHLYARIGKGRSAKRKMIAANLPLVSFIAKEFHGRGLSHQELCQEGVMGLMKSTEKFDISHNSKFSTYAYFWIHERMSAAVQKFQSIWMVGKSLQKMVSSVLQCKDEFCQLNGRCPSMDELSIASKVEKTKIRQAFFAIRSTRTLSRNTYDEECRDGKEAEDSKSDLPWRAMWQSELQAELQQLFDDLSPRESQTASNKSEFKFKNLRWSTGLKTGHNKGMYCRHKESQGAPSFKKEQKSFYANHLVEIGTGLKQVMSLNNTAATA